MATCENLKEFIRTYENLRKLDEKLVKNLENSSDKIRSQSSLVPEILNAIPMVNTIH